MSYQLNNLKGTDLLCVFNVGGFLLINNNLKILCFIELLLKLLDSTICFKVCDFKSLPLRSFMRSEILTNVVFSTCVIGSICVVYHVMLTVKFTLVFYIKTSALVLVLLIVPILP